MRRQGRLGIVLVVAGVIALGAVSSAETAPEPPASGFRALGGAEAADFALPPGLRLVRRLELSAYGLTYERYQQVFGAANARVYGGQLTVHRLETGRVTAVIGAHYPDIRPTNRVSVTSAEARRKAATDIPDARERSVELMINPTSGRYFYWVESYSFGQRWVHWFDAGSGRLLRRFDAVAHDHGIGVKGDTKSMSGLTKFHATSHFGTGVSGPHYDLMSSDGRQTTFDVRNGSLFLYDAVDSDNHWITLGRASPGQPALVDAHYYANQTDDYLQARVGFNWVSCFGSGGQRSGAHYGLNYNNAFFDGRYVIFGDGDGVSYREFGGALDVVAHEHAHGVTQCTSDLTYTNEPGALNEAFSDILGNSAEFFAAEPLSSNCSLASGQAACADWWIGEDVDIRNPADTTPGFRNMADPEEDRTSSLNLAHPDHYSERYSGTSDNGGVHVNSAIANHAYYLLVNGGRNASCDAPETHNAGHCGDADTQDEVTVAGIGLPAAERIFFLGFTALPQSATMCQAREAAVAVAGSHASATRNAWLAVGLTDAVCGPGGGGGTNTTPTADDKTATTNAATPVEITLSGADAETCELLFSIVAGPANGTLGAIGNGACTGGSPNTDSATVTYVPNSGFAGDDQFTYRANDGSADSSLATVRITVNSPSGGPNEIHVGDLDYVSTRISKGRWKATVTVLVHDGAEAPVSSAAVSGSFSQGSWSGAVSCTTGVGGTCTVDSGAFPSSGGQASFTITDLTAGTATYVPAQNHDPEGNSNGTTIAISK